MIYKRQSQPRAEQPVRMVNVRIGHDVSDSESMDARAQTTQQQNPIQTFGQFLPKSYSLFIHQKNLDAQSPQMAASQFVPSQPAPLAGSR